MSTVCLEPKSVNMHPENNGVGAGPFRLMISDSGEVELSYHEVFDRITGESDFFYGIFPRENYRQGLRDLRDTSKCTIKGNNCSLEIARNLSNFHVYFNTPDRSLAVTQKSLQDLLYLAFL